MIKLKELTELPLKRKAIKEPEKDSKLAA